jgi:poly(3-hydroxybutyrate) depolymerase
MAPAGTFWTVLHTDAWGYWNQGQVTKTLLDNGVAVITPEALGQGLTAWGTNVPPTSLDWEGGRDHALMLDLFEHIDAGELGPLDAEQLFAAGISSGGYMTSRMADAYPGRFSALAIHSGAYMTCTNLACDTPAQPADHPPTLFLHGGLDLVVPARTMRAYDDALQQAGVETRVVEDEWAGHARIDAAPDEILEWFQGP